MALVAINSAPPVIRPRTAVIAHILMLFPGASRWLRSIVRSRSVARVYLYGMFELGDQPKRSRSSISLMPASASMVAELCRQACG